MGRNRSKALLTQGILRICLHTIVLLVLNEFPLLLIKLPCHLVYAILLLLSDHCQTNCILHHRAWLLPNSHGIELAV